MTRADEPAQHAGAQLLDRGEIFRGQRSALGELDLPTGMSAFGERDRQEPARKQTSARVKTEPPAGCTISPGCWFRAPRAWL